MTNNEMTEGLLNRPVLEPLSIKGFCGFLKNNIPLVIAASIAVVFIGGARLIWRGDIFDDIVRLSNNIGTLKIHASNNRFGAAILTWLLSREFNPYTQVFAATGILWCAVLSWCYIIAVFQGNTGRDNRFILFALLFSSSLAIRELFLCPSATGEFICLLLLCPYAVHLFYKGFLDNEKGKIALAFVILVFMIGIYEGGAVPAFCCGVFLCFLLLQERTSYEPKVYSRLCLKLFIALLLASAVYLIINRFIVQGILQIEKLDYYSDPVKWLKRPLRETILTILMQGYVLTIGDIPFVQHIVHPRIADLTKLPASPTVEQIALFSRAYSNVILLPAAVLFLVSIVKKASGIIPKGRRLLYVLAGIGVPFSIIMITVIFGSAVPYRALWAMSPAMAFMCFYLSKTWKHKKAVFVLWLLVLFVSARQLQTTALSFYAGYKYYEEEVRLSVDLNRRIQEVQPETGKLPVAMVGGYDYSVPNLLGTQASMWARAFDPTSNRSSLGLVFMNLLGMQYDPPDDSQWKTILAGAASMPSYPAPGCVQRLSGVVVVKLSEDEYPDKLPGKWGLWTAREWMGR
jgi:hypothetical protein